MVVEEMPPDAGPFLSLILFGAMWKEDKEESDLSWRVVASGLARMSRFQVQDGYIGNRFGPNI